MLSNEKGGPHTETRSAILQCLSRPFEFSSQKGQPTRMTCSLSFL